MVQRRVWTPQSIDAWEKERNERRKSKGLLPIEVLNPSEKARALETERQEVIESEFNRLTTQAWILGKWPLDSFPAPFSGFIQLPKSYHAKDGIDKFRVRERDDLNRIVHKYYDEGVDAKLYPGDNYVSKDGFSSRRHEYMGPSPRVASYRFTDNQIEIEWWEEYIKDAWIGRKKWKVEAELDQAVEGWFLVDRNDY